MANAGKIGSFCLFGSEFHFIFKTAIQVVGSQQQIACLRGCAVFFGVAAFLSQSVAVTKILVYIFISDIQGLDT